MRNLILLASAAAIAATIPALAEAKPGKGQSARTEVRSNGHARTDSRANARARTRTGASVDRRIDTDRDGIPDYRDRTDNRRGNRYGGAACPPGLAKRTPACVPPGQARRTFRQGQRVPASYRDYVAYQDLLGRLPESYRDDIPAGDYRYIYDDDRVYVVNARTRLISSIINILR
ncbi:hypothetical protein [Allosphingosinicella sp.]|jgi:hypothetical protein|uniref:hypothetical protein n=1 Tax=Allosphingosinicella sp. TaxID=2823234 RepID=UPI002F12AA99